MKKATLHESVDFLPWGPRRTLSVIRGFTVKGTPIPRLTVLSLLAWWCFAPLLMGGELHEAVRACNVDNVKSLVSKGAPINEQDSDGMYPLHLAIDARQTQCVGLLLRAGADRYRKDRHGRTAFEAASQISDRNLRGQILLLVWHSGKGMTTEPTDPNLGSLERWTMRGSTGVAELLLNLGADPNEMSTSGSFPLADAALRGDLDLVRVLIARGANIGALTRMGTQAIHEAALGGHPDVVLELVKKGADMNARAREDSQTPLHIASVMGRASVVAALVSLGADLHAKDAKGLTPLQAAERAGTVEIVSFLKRAEADAAKNSQQTPQR